MLDDIVSLLNSKVSGCQAEAVRPEVGDGSVVIKGEKILDACCALKESEEYQFNVLQVITGCDYEDRIEVSYILASFIKNLELILKVKLPKSSPDTIPAIESLCSLWKSANFLERECYDMLGIKFLNHPDLRRILCPYEEWQGYPLRKDYKVQEKYLNMTVNPPEKMNSEDHYFYKQLEAEYGEDAKKVTHSWKD